MFRHEYEWSDRSDTFESEASDGQRPAAQRQGSEVINFTYCRQEKGDVTQPDDTVAKDATPVCRVCERTSQDTFDRRLQLNPVVKLSML